MAEMLTYGKGPKVLLLPDECDDPGCWCHEFYAKFVRPAFKVVSSGRQHYKADGAGRVLS